MEKQQIQAHEKKISLDRLRAIVADILKITIDDLDDELPFIKMGLRGRKSVELIQCLNEQFDCHYTPSLLFQYPTINLLYEYLLSVDSTKVKQTYTIQEPIAMIGMACRTPGANNIDEFWDILIQGQDAITKIPADRWAHSNYFDSDYDAPGKIAVDSAGFMDHVYDFDDSLFNISHAELLEMDPQQRILMEVAWEALETACIVPDKNHPQPIGVFIGLHNSDYFRQNMADHEQVNAYTVSGSALSIASGRLAYQFGFTGPAVSIDTACSSSLMAVHLASQSLRTGECRVAIAGGVNLILSADFMMSLSKARMLSAGGHCHTFSEHADGYARAEGCGVVVLKRLQDAIDDDDHIFAVIKASATNQDGFSNGLTAPNMRAQVDVITRAIGQAGLNSADISYIEAHGTGTVLGDLVELEALKQVFDDTSKTTWVGSVKANIGHTETAAGVLGLIKSTLILKHGQIPAQIHAQPLNTHVDWTQSLAIPATKTPLPSEQAIHHIGISSFGFSGTNVHTIIQSPSKRDVKPTEASVPQLVRLSASHPHALTAYADKLRDYLMHTDESIEDICYVLNQHRAICAYRFGFLVNSIEDFIAQLESPPDIIHVKNQRKNLRVGFVFSGQGDKNFSFVKAYYHACDTFRHHLDACHRKLSTYEQFSQRSILGFLSEDFDTATLADTTYYQPLLFSIHYALAKTLLDFGLEPIAMIGHSIGEYAAACIAGALSLEQVLALVIKRSELMASIKQAGQMLVTFCSQDDIQNIQREHSDLIEIAVVNNKNNHVIAVRWQDSQAVQNILQQRNINFITLPLNTAFHSSHMDEITEDFSKFCQQFKFQAPSHPLISNVSGDFFDTEQPIMHEYWSLHLRETVCFQQGIETLCDFGLDVFIEIGPGQSMQKILRDMLSARQTVISCFDQGFILPKAHAMGLVNNSSTGQKKVLPTYCFQHNEFNKFKPRHPHQQVSDALMNSTSPEQTVLGCIAQLLKMRPTEIDISHNFLHYGFDSLMALNLKNKLNTMYDVDISITRIFSSKSIEDFIHSCNQALIPQQTKSAPIVKEYSNKAVYPLSYSQEQLYFLQQLQPNTPAYNLPVLLKITGPVAKDVLDKVLNHLLEAHDILRVNIDSNQAQAIQYVKPYQSQPMLITDFSADANAYSLALDYAQTQASQVLDLKRDPLFKYELLIVSDDISLLLLQFHHMIMDGWSLIEVLMPQIVEQYQAITQQKPLTRSNNTLDYLQYAENQREKGQGDSVDANLAYWVEKLHGSSFKPLLISDYKMQEMTQYQGKRKVYPFPVEIAHKIKSRCHQYQYTTFSFVMTVFSLLIKQWSSQDDFIIGTTFSNRQHMMLENLIGDFTNNLPIRIEIDNEQSLDELIWQLQTTILEAYDHIDCPMQRIVEAIHPARRGNRNPLYNISCVMHTFNGLKPSWRLSEQTTLQFQTPTGQIDNHTAEIDLLVEVLLHDDALYIECEFDTSLYHESTIDNLMASFQSLLDLCSQRPSEPIKSLLAQENPVLDVSDIRPVSFKQTSLLDVFNQRAEDNPQAIAVHHNQIDYSYEDIKQLANTVAHQLKEAGVKSGEVVGIELARSHLVVASILAAYQLGAHYVYIDPLYPEKHRQLLIDSASLKVLIADTPINERVSDVITIDIQKLKNESHHAETLYTPVSHESPAYVIFTSGSTGVPKGVEVSHANVLSLLERTQALFDFTARDVWTAFHSCSFDFYIWEMWGAFYHGAKLIMLPFETTRRPELFYQALREHQVTVLNQTPSAFYQLIQHCKASSKDQLSDLRYIIFGGEKLEEEKLDYWVNQYGFDSPKLINMYGITEITVHATFKQIQPVTHKTAYDRSIGMPLPGSRIDIVNEYHQLLPKGAVGEMVVTGPGVACRYINNQPLTNEKFIQQLHPNIPGRSYITGDYGRILPNGEIQYLGRIDKQVKLRGFRIELGHIESVIRQHVCVADSKVRLNGEGNQKNLTAYIIPDFEQTKQLINQDIHEYLKQWQSVFNSTYQSQHDLHEHDYSGWNSSYSGTQIADDEMSEWVNTTIDEISALNPKHILEIGCGTGLLLFNLIDKCESYTATDISNQVIENVGKRLHSLGDKAKHVKTYHQPAHDFKHIDQNKYDLIILNSIIQYFPSVKYLEDVLAQLQRVLTPNGKIYIGDIRNYDSYDLFVHSVVATKKQASPNQEIASECQRFKLEEKEILLSPDYFNALVGRSTLNPSLSITLRRGVSLNEMTKYRFNVLIDYSSKCVIPTERFEIIDWEQSKNEINALLNRQQPIRIKNIPNARLADDLSITRAELSSNIQGVINPGKLLSEAEALGYQCALTSASSHRIDQYDAYFKPKSHVNITPILFPAYQTQENNEQLTNDVPSAFIHHTVNRLISDDLSTSLPQHMIPTHLVFLNQFPLTLNGKCDEQALQRMMPLTSQSSEHWVEPKSSLEKYVYHSLAKLLANKQLSMEMKFFEVGANSIIATQFVSKLSNELGIDYPLIALFKNPSLAEIASSIQARIEKASEEGVA